MKRSDLLPKEFNSYYTDYLNLVHGSTSVHEALNIGLQESLDFINSIDKNLDYRYGSDKWTIAQVIMHNIDTERVFIYRLFCIARNDTTNFPGYDQEIYIKPSGADAKTLDVLVDEFKTTRAYSIHILESLEDAALKNMGMVSDSPISARACAFLLLGHSIWHMDVIKNRYL